jgi:hypothetical protein
MTGGLGATKIFVTAGGKAQASCAGQAMEMVRKEGTVALFASADVTADELVVSINKIHYDMLHLTGTVGFSKEHGEKALALLASGIFNPMLIRNYELPLEKLDEAVRLYGKGAHLKIGLDLKGSVAKSKTDRTGTDAGTHGVRSWPSACRLFRGGEKHPLFTNSAETARRTLNRRFWKPSRI